MPKLNDIEVVLARKKVDMSEIQESKTEENKNKHSNRIFLDRKANKQMGMGFLVNKSRNLTGTNLVN